VSGEIRAGILERAVLDRSDFPDVSPCAHGPARFARD
jgi:hypothetical protein